MSATAKKPTHKYRPVLTAEQISHILSKVRSTPVPSQLDLQVLAVLAPFEAKILMGAVSPAYTEKYKETMEDKLGIHPPDTTKLNIPKEVYWEECYNKYIAKIPCTIEEIVAAKEHMYLHDLMTPEQRVQFERETESDFVDSYIGNKGE